MLELVETRVGEPLAMQDVRGTIEHLVGLGRFEDVRVFASGTDQGVALRWQLVPVRRITQDHGDRQRRAAGAGRFAASSPIASARRRRRIAIDEMVAALTTFYRDRGFERAVDPAARAGRRPGARASRSWS